MASNRILFLGTARDAPYLPRLKAVVGTAIVSPVLSPISTLAEVTIPCTKRGITKVISTSQVLLQKLVSLQGDTGRKKPSIDNYAGSYFSHAGMEFVFIDPLEQLVSVNHGAFLTRRYISKLAAPEEWTSPVPTFTWSICDESNATEIYEKFKGAYAIAADIETFSTPPSIRCVGYTGIFLGPNGAISTYSIVIPLTSQLALAWVRKFNALPAPKIFQNGKYDISYLSMYDAVPHNYLWDTAHLFHSWYSELPKDLGFLQAFFVREAAYWKDLASSSDLHQYYLYNAKDTWATACVWMAQMLEMPAWATKNYLNEFPLVFPCHLAEMTGIKRDIPELTIAHEEATTKLAVESTSLNRMLGVKAGASFNTNSPIQMKQLLAVLGCKDLESADEKNLKKASTRHPLNALIINKIISIRKTRKLISTYLTTGKEFNGYILYSLNPHATDTSRLASREHHFWCGLQIQNIPRGAAVKRTLVAGDGYRMAECDLSQAESRDTAYIAGDESLIVAVTGTRDFHSVNTAAFFGVPYDSIYSDAEHRTINKKLRDLAKRVNHGANYNMGPDVMVDTMGLELIWEAQRLLGLPKFWTPRQVAEHLLAVFHRTYPSISKLYYPAVVHEIVTTHMHSSKATHECKYQAATEGLTRYCFGHPDKNKRDLNSYVAHPPQSLNAMTLNKAFMIVFYEIALHPTHSQNFRLHAQIHDSILFSFREGHEYLATMVQEAMQIPVTVKGCDGKTRTFTVPASIKAGKDGKGSHRWSEIE